MTRQPLDKALRRTLEATVIKARDIAEQAATQAVKRLGVGDAKPADYLNDEQRKLRTRLRAHGRQLGDNKDGSGQQFTHKLVTEVAYEHWHRMLFARFLEQNNLLMYDEHTSLTLAECSGFFSAFNVWKSPAKPAGTSALNKIFLPSGKNFGLLTLTGKSVSWRASPPPNVSSCSWFFSPSRLETNTS